ncbi:hypothetical protein V8C37DRAFT_213881 [Trichoderma ceciliae]
MDDGNAKQPLTSDTGDGTQATPTPQDTRRESDTDTTKQERVDYVPMAPVADTKRAAYLKLSSTWCVEIIAMCISLACMAVLVGILARFQDRLSTEWSFIISLNAAVAIVITAARATLLTTISACLGQEKWRHFSTKSHRLQDLDTIGKASRGSLGSLLMLFKVSRGFASIGAIAFILSTSPNTIPTYLMGKEIADIDVGVAFKSKENG